MRLPLRQIRAIAAKSRFVSKGFKRGGFEHVRRTISRARRSFRFNEILKKEGELSRLRFGLKRGVKLKKVRRIKR